MINIVRRNDVFHTQKLEESFQISKSSRSMEHLTESKKKIGHKSPEPLTTKDVISEVKMMKQYSI